MDLKQQINVLLCIDDFKGDYTRHCAVTILSLLETNKNHRIKIFIMSCCLPEENVKELERIVESYNQEIEFIIRDNLIPEQIKKSVINRRNLTWGTWYRLFFSSYVKNIDRLLYLDCDVLVTKDIAEIYNMEMNGKAIMGYYDIPMTRFISEKYFNLNQYINAGVLLIDVKKFSKYKFTEDLIVNINKRYGIHIDNSDQDYLNIIFKDDIFIYKKSFNYLVASKFFNKGLDDAKIIHCLSKPYVQYSNIPQKLVDLYYKYLNMTKRKGYPEEKANYGCLMHYLLLIRNFCSNLLVKILGDKLVGKIFGSVYAFLLNVTNK